MYLSISITRQTPCCLQNCQWLVSRKKKKKHCSSRQSKKCSGGSFDLTSKTCFKAIHLNAPHVFLIESEMRWKLQQENNHLHWGALDRDINMHVVKIMFSLSVFYFCFLPACLFSLYCCLGYLLVHSCFINQCIYSLGFCLSVLLMYIWVFCFFWVVNERTAAIKSCTFISPCCNQSNACNE